MKIERRALIAFVLSMLLFLLYDAVYLSPKMEKQRERREQQAAEIERQRLPAGDTLDAAQTEPETAYDSRREETSPETAQEKPSFLPRTAQTDTVVTAAEFTVASPLYEITLSTAGAEILSVRLLEYTTNEQPVELIPQNPDWAYPRAINTSLDGPGSSTALSDMSFEAFKDGGITPLLDGARVVVDERRGETEIVFQASQDGEQVIERYYRFFDDRYDFETGVRFSTQANPSVTGVTWGLGEGMNVTEENVKDDQQNFKASIKLGEEVHRLKPGHFGKKNAEEFSGTLTWASIQTKYFTAIMLPKEAGRATATIWGDKSEHQISQRITLPAVPRQNAVDQSIRVYMGPLDYARLKAFGVGLEGNIEMGMRIIRPVSWLVLWSMTWTYKYIPNYGIVIILISVITKILFYRLTHKSFKSMKDLQDLQPRMQALKEKYKEDRQKLSQETMKLYKQAGVNPLGGCLPLLLQMPVFIALFNVLKYTIEVRGAHFAGWITDLAHQDVLFKLPFSLPLIGDNFSLLPILMGASMLLQTKIGGSITPGSPNTQTPPGFQTMLPIVFTFLFYKMPSGLVLYWLVNTVLSIAQQYYIHKADHKPTDGADGDKPANNQKRRLKTKGR